MADRVGEVVELAAPDPIVVIEIRIALGAATAGAMAGRAVFAESRTPLRACKLEQLWIGNDLLQGGSREPRDHRAALGPERLKLGHDRLA